MREKEEGEEGFSFLFGSFQTPNAIMVRWNQLSITLSDVMDAASDKGDNNGLREKNRFMRYELIFVGEESVKGVKFAVIVKINK